MSDVEKQLLRASDLVAMGIVGSKATLYRWCALGLFPKPVRLTPAKPPTGPPGIGDNSKRKGGGTSVFRKADIDAWLAEREAPANVGVPETPTSAELRGRPLMPGHVANTVLQDITLAPRRSRSQRGPSWGATSLPASRSLHQGVLTRWARP